MFLSNLKRPLAFIDIESTGINPRQDRIIDLAVVKLMPDGSQQARVFRCNPGIPIPAAAEAIHHISEADIADCPLFAQIAGQVHEALQGCDLAGFGIARFDIPMLTEEFARAGLKFPADDCRVVDAQRIFHKKEPRDLTAALAFYCGAEHAGAHGAEADARATVQVLEAQMGRYTDLPQTVEGLDAFCAIARDPDWVDRSGKLKWVNGEVVINFGVQHAGRKLRELAQNNAGFLKWILKSDFPGETKRIVAEALEGKFPARPAAAQEARE